jgi:AcrR family transcriptional regulator
MAASQKHHKAEPAEPSPIRRRDSEATRQALMKAGLREFSQHGFAGGRIERVAKSAKRNIRMVYHYFGDKKGLYVAVLEAAYADLRRRELDLDIDPEHPLEGMLELMRFTFGYFEANPMFEGLLRAENMIQGKFVSRSRSVPEEASFPVKTITALIASGQARGIFRDDLDAVNIYATITALSRFHLANAFTMSAVLGTDLRDKHWRAQRLEHCIEVLRAYVLKPAPPSTV